MILKRQYKRPDIYEVELDKDISVFMASEDTEPDPGEHPGGDGAGENVNNSVSTFDSKQSGSGINENPFK